MESAAVQTASAMTVTTEGSNLVPSRFEIRYFSSNKNATLFVALSVFFSLSLFISDSEFQIPDLSF